MTNEQKIRIASLRRAGLGYTAIAREIGLTKSAISNYCRGNGLGSIIEGKGKNDLQKSSVRVITSEAPKPVQQGTSGFRVTTIFADEPNEAAVAEALRILTNVR